MQSEQVWRSGEAQNRTWDSAYRASSGCTNTRPQASFQRSFLSQSLAETCFTALSRVSKVSRPGSVSSRRYLVSKRPQSYHHLQSFTVENAISHPPPILHPSFTHHMTDDQLQNGNSVASFAHQMCCRQQL
ncbi:uncharacterized protein YALI1_B11120g [Yarrowia lipolytica]|uniref:Uncharacterized protein n=1 Tax=Yarrowia lipolytica TaxID=4952 RepID=A0A1D8N6Z3_YARLL|nr:hypothetical protein YALI1_B11120g [Yarrowia lipolytica]